MRRRSVVLIAALAALLAAGAVAAAFGSGVLQLESMAYQWTGDETQEQMDEMNRASQFAWRLAETFPWISLAALLAGVAALALAARRAQLQLAGIRTVSEPASTSALNPTTMPNSSPSSSNSSARSSFTSNTDALR